MSQVKSAVNIKVTTYSYREEKRGIHKAFFAEASFLSGLAFVQASCAG